MSVVTFSLALATARSASSIVPYTFLIMTYLLTAVATITFVTFVVLAIRVRVRLGILDLFKLLLYHFSLTSSLFFFSHSFRFFLLSVDFR